MLKLTTFVSGPLENNLFVIHADGSQDCAIVDPGIDQEPVYDFVEQNKLVVKLILVTHGHFDHVFSIADCKMKYGAAQIAAHPDAQHFLDMLVSTSSQWGFTGAKPAPPIDVELTHGGKIELAGHEIEVRHTPGHSPGQVAFLFGKNAVVGDTLFYRSIGRSDLPGSDYGKLERSIIGQLYTLPDDTVVHPGHGPTTTIGEEKQHNPFVPMS